MKQKGFCATKETVRKEINVRKSSQAVQLAEESVEYVFTLERCVST